MQADGVVTLQAAPATRPLSMLIFTLLRPFELLLWDPITVIAFVAQAKDWPRIESTQILDLDMKIAICPIRKNRGM